MVGEYTSWYPGCHRRLEKVGRTCRALDSYQRLCLQRTSKKPLRTHVLIERDGEGPGKHGAKNQETAGEHRIVTPPSAYDLLRIKRLINNQISGMPMVG